jgi:serine/threonine-protein kinase
VSQGNTLAPLPTDLAGQPFDAAAAALQAAGGFTVKRVDLQSEEVPKDTVIGYSVVDGQPVASQLPKQSEVSLDVSSGPAPRTVPGDLGDGTYQGAVAALQAVQLKASQVDVFSDTVPAGKVVGTDPGAGAKAPRDSTVKVQVSKGPDLVAVPNVKGKTLAQANDALEAAGLTPGNVFGPSKGTPFTTEPEAGTKVKRGTKVDIYLK